MLNPRLVVSASISGSRSAQSIPGPINVTGSNFGPGGVDAFDVSEYGAFSVQAFVTGSSVNGMLYLQQSNNMTGWVSIMSQSIAGVVNQDYLFPVAFNTSGFARLLWTGTASADANISVSSAGIR